MSTLSGLATKGEKGKSKFQSLDINSIYRGESLEPAQKTILRKHGMQSLGRVPCARRAPANLPSLKAETSGADPPVSLVPSGGTGWGSKPSGEGANASATSASTPTQGPVAAAALLPPATMPLSSNTTQPTSQTPLPQSRQQPIPGSVGTAAASQGLGTGAASGQSQQPSPLVGGPASGGALGHPLPLVAQLPLQEFPKLSGGSETDGSAPNAASGASSVSGVSQLTGAKGGSAPGVDVQYGPGPSLRPQSMVGDGLGARGAALGALPGGPSTPLVQTQGVGTGGGGGVPQGVGGNAPTPSAGVGAAAGGGGSGGAGTPFSGIMPRFLYRGGFPGPGGFQPNFQASLHGGAPRPQRFGYPSSASGPGGVGATEGEGGPGGRFGPGAGGRPPGPPNAGQGGPAAPPPEDEVFQRPIIKEEDLNKMDDIVRGNGWATQDDIDYNQKLAFSDDESTEDDGSAGHSLRKDAGATSNSQQQGGGRALNQNLSGSQHHHPIPLLQQPQTPPLHMHLKGKEPEGRRNTGPLGRGGAVTEDERDGLDLDHRDEVRGRIDDRSRDPKRLDGTRLVDGRSGWGQPASRSGAPPPLMPPSMLEYRGGPRGTGNMGVASSQQGPASVPQTSIGNLMQGPFKLASHMPFGGASSRIVDDEEVWRERRRQTNEEVAIAVVRAKQRKEEEEKKFEETKQAAAKKLQNLEEKMGVNKEKKESQVQQQHHQAEEGSQEWERDRSRTSSEGREEKGVAPAPTVARETLREIPRDSPGEREFRPAPPLMGSDRVGSGFSRDRDRDRELRGERDRDRHDYKFSRQFQSNLPPRFQRQQQQAEQQHIPALRGASSPPPNSRPRPASGPTPPGGTQVSLTPSPPSVTSSEPSTPAEGRGSSLTHESRWGSLGSSQPPLHYSAQGVAGIKSGSGPGRRGVRDEPIPSTDRERERDRETERDREDRSVCIERGRVSGSSSEPTRASTNSAPLDIRDKERASEPKRVIPTSEDRDRRMDDRYRHGRDVRGPTMQGGYLENGRRGYYDGPDYGRGYGRGPPQDYDFDRNRGERDHSGDADPPRFSDSRHGTLPQNRDFDIWERERERDKEGRAIDKERIPDARDRPLEKDRERVIDRERLADRERPVDRERGAERERERDRVLDRDRDRERVPDRDRERERMVDRVAGDRDGRRVDRVSERDDRIDRERAQERDRILDRERLPDRDRGLERLDRERGPERANRGPGDRDRPSDRDRNGERERVADRDRPVERDRPSDRERTGERDRPNERDRPSDRDRPVERDRAGDRDRAADRERPLDRDRAVDRDRPSDRDRPVDRDRASDRDRITERERTDRDRPVERERAGDRDRQGDRGFEGDIRGADRERSVTERERNHERGPNERERGLSERVVSRERLGRDRGVVERDVERERERAMEVERTLDRERAGDGDRGGRPGERGLDRVSAREAEYRDVRRFDDRRGGDPVDSKKAGSGELYPERRGPPQQQDSFEPEVDGRQVGLEWRDSKEWKEDRRSGALLGDERRQGSEDRPQRPDSRDERTGRDGRRETNRENKSGQLTELSGEGGKGPPGNGGRRGDFVTSTSWADTPVEPLYPDVPEEKKEEYFRNEHRPLIDSSSSVDRKGLGESGVVGEGAWGFPRGGPPSACAQGHAPRGPGAEQAGVAGVAAGAPPTRGPPNRLSPSPPPPTTTTTPTPSGEGPPSPGRLPRVGPLPLASNSTVPPPPLLPPPRPQRQLSNTTTPTTPVGETTTWADEPAIAVDLMQPQEERLAREMLPSVGEGITMMDGKSPVNDKLKTDGLEEKDVESVKEEEKKEEEPLPKRERGGRGRSANQGSRSRQQGGATQSSRSGGQWGGSISAIRGGSAQGRSHRAPGMKWTAEEEEEESEVRAGEGDSEFSAEEEGSGESGREGRGGRSAQVRADGESETPASERSIAAQDSKRVQGREGFAPRGEPSRRGRGGGAGFRTRGNIGRRIDRYGPPPSACPFGQPRDEGQAVESLEEVDEKDKGKPNRGGQPPGPVGSGKDALSNRAGKAAQGSSTIPPRMQRRGESERSRKGRGGRGGSSGESGSHRGSDGGRKHVTGPESRQGSSDVAEWETTSENSDAEDSGRERREGKRGKGQRGWSGSAGDGVTAPGNSAGPAVGSGIAPTSRAPGAEKKSASASGGSAGTGQRTSPAPSSRGKSSGKGKDEGGNADASRRGGSVISGGQGRSSHTPLMGVNLDIGGEKALDGMDMGTYSSVTPADDRHPGAEDQGDPPFPFDADSTGFREVRGRRGGGRIGMEENNVGPPPRQQQQPSQRQQRREGSRGEGRGGKGGGKGQAPVGVGRSSGGAPRTGTPSPGPANSVSATSGPCRPGSPSSVAGGSFERNRPKLPPRLIKQKETERLQKQQAQQQQQQQGRGGHMGSSFGGSAYHSHHGASSSHLRNDVGEVNHQQHHHPGKVVGSSGVLFSMKERPISSGVNAWDKPLGASSAIGSSSPASSSGGVGLGVLGGPGSSVGEERGENGGGGHRDSPTGTEVGSGLGNGIAKVPSVQKLAVEKPSSVLLDGTSPPVQTIIFENTNYKSGPPAASAAQVPKFNSHHHHPKMPRVLEKGRGNDRKLSDDDDVALGYGNHKNIIKVGGIEVKTDPMQLPLGFTKNSEDNSEMKLDFAFHSELSQLTEEKAHGGGSVKSGNNSSAGGGGGGTIGGGMALQRNIHTTSTLGPAAELNYKIAAVKTFWENSLPMPTVLEMSEGNDGGTGVVVASSSVAAATSASPSSSSPSLAPGVVTTTTGFVVDQPSSSVVVVTGEDGSGLNATEVVFSPGTPMQASNSFGVAPATLGKGDPNSTSSNVCKVKPQQQTAVMSTGPSPIGHPGPLSPPPYNSSSAQATSGHINYQPTIGGTAQFGGMSAIPSPPSVIFNSSQQIPAQGGLYGAFPIDGQVLGGGARSQFPQFPSPYGLSQSIGGTSAFSPQSMYLHQAAPHPPPPPPSAAPDMYQSSISQFRIQAAATAPYGGSGHHVGGTTPPQAPTAVLISTPPANSLAAVKPPPSQGQGTGGSQGAGGGGGGAGPQQPPPSQGGPPGAVGSKGAGGHYGTGTLGSGIPSAPQPSPLYIQYNEQGQAVLNHSFLSAGSQIVQRTGPVQSTVVPPPIQPPTSFYSTSAGGQTNFYQPGSSGLGQAAQLHQSAAAAAAAAASQFGLAQGFGPSQSAPAPVGLQSYGSQMAAAQQYRSPYLKSGGGGGGSGMGGPSDHLQQGVGGRSQLKSPSANPGSQQQAPPPDVLTSAFSSAQIPSPKARNTKLQSGPVGGQGNQQQQPSPTQPNAHQKFSSYPPVAALVLQQQQNNNVRNQMSSGMGSLMRGGGGATGSSMNSAPSRYPAPIQRPVALPPSGGNSGRHRMPQQQQRANNLGKHYFGQDSKNEDGSDSGKVPVDGGKAANGRNGDSGTAPTAPSPPGPNPTAGQPSVPTSSSPTNPSGNSDSQAEGGPSLEEQGPPSSAGTE